MNNGLAQLLHPNVHQNGKTAYTISMVREVSGLQGCRVVVKFGLIHGWIANLYRKERYETPN